MGLIALMLALLLTGCGGAAPSQSGAASDFAASSSLPAAVSSTVSETISSAAASAPEPEPELEPEPVPGELDGMIVCIDPGHGVTSARGQEAVSPLSGETKAAYVSGASGRQITEEALNLQVSLRLRARLEAMGATVVMTRETNEATVSNIERAQIANQAGADVCIRIHADGIEDSSVNGVSVLIPAGSLLGTPAIAEPSAALGQLMVDAVAAQTGAKNRGTTERRDLTGFNWSEVPCVLLEMGFLSNAQEEANMIDPAYQDKIVEGIAAALVQWAS